MRRIKLDSWATKPAKPRKRLPRQKPSSKWQLTNSILFIKAMDEYLRKEGILIKIGKRRYRMKI